MNRFRTLKGKYKDKVLLIKNGLFYVTYEEDALMVHRVTNYKLLLPDYRLGIPSKKLTEVIDRLNRKYLSVVVIDKNNATEYSSPKNRYLEVVLPFKNKIEYYQTIDLYLDDIRNKIILNNSLLVKIKEVVDKFDQDK